MLGLQKFLGTSHVKRGVHLQKAQMEKLRIAPYLVNCMTINPDPAQAIISNLYKIFEKKQWSM